MAPEVAISSPLIRVMINTSFPSPSQTTITSPGNTARSTRTILFALDTSESDIFLGNKPPPPSGEFELTSINSREVRGADWLSCLERVQPEVLVSCWSTPPLPSLWLDHPECPLQYVCHITGTIRGLIPRSYLERGGRVSNWGGIPSSQVAEHALLLGLAALRNLPAWESASFWEAKRSTRTLFEKSVGIHGYGRIARCLVQLLRPFGVRIKAYSAGVPALLMQKDGVEPCASLTELFVQSDVLFECEALNATSARSVDARTLAALPDGGVFVNVGRGALVDEAALVREAKSGRIRIALDVTTVEPVPIDSELRNLRNVLLSPHIGGPTGDRYRRCGEAAMENLWRYSRNLPIEDEVTLDLYDRST